MLDELVVEMLALFAVMGTTWYILVNVSRFHTVVRLTPMKSISELRLVDVLEW